MCAQQGWGLGQGLYAQSLIPPSWDSRAVTRVSWEQGWVSVPMGRAGQSLPSVSGGDLPWLSSRRLDFSLVWFYLFLKAVSPSKVVLHFAQMLQRDLETT